MRSVAILLAAAWLSGCAAVPAVTGASGGALGWWATVESVNSDIDPAATLAEPVLAAWCRSRTTRTKDADIAITQACIDAPGITDAAGRIKLVFDVMREIEAGELGAVRHP